MQSAIIHRPNRIADVFSFPNVCGEMFSFVAGGTDWTIRKRNREMQEGVIVDLSDVAELKGISVASGDIRIGAGETMTAIAGNSALALHARCLCEAAGSVGSWQIRNRATLGGNLANASPAADTPIALAALDAVVEVFSPRGGRALCVCDIPNGPNATILERDELITVLRIPLVPVRTSAFVKVGGRKEMSIARLNVAVSLVERDGQTGEARVCIGTLGSAIRRVAVAEDVLNTTGLGDIGAFCDALESFVEHAIPGRHSLPHKCSVARALGEDVLQALRERRRGSG